MDNNVLYITAGDGGEVEWVVVVVVVAGDDIPYWLKDVWKQL